MFLKRCESHASAGFSRRSIDTKILFCKAQTFLTNYEGCTQLNQEKNTSLNGKWEGKNHKSTNGICIIVIIIPVMVKMPKKRPLFLPASMICSGSVDPLRLRAAHNPTAIINKYFMIMATTPPQLTAIMQELLEKRELYEDNLLPEFSGYV